MNDWNHEQARLKGHELAVELLEILQKKLDELGISTTSEAVYIVSIICSQIAASSLMGALKRDSLKQKSVIDGLIGGFVTLFKGNCELIVQQRIREEGIAEDTVNTPASISKDPWD